MSTVYSHISSNIYKTWILISAFLVFIVFLGWFFSQMFQNQIILYFAIFFAFVQSFLSYWYSDKITTFLVGAKPLEKKDNPLVYRLVENLCIASGLPMPKIYVAEEKQMNAFATGRDEKHAAIVLNRGLIEKLEDEELEGVIAHELSHIKNKDILLGSVVVVLVSVVAILSDYFLRLLWWQRVNERDERNNFQAILFLLAIFVAVLAPIIATLIQFAISRKREFLADASAALLTRYPEGLARALEKISQDNTPLKRESLATAHLYIANPFKKKNWLLNLFSTHPPVEERIKALREMAI